MFIRFVVHALDPDSNERKGIFQASSERMARFDLTDAERAWPRAVREWFAEHLRTPTKFATSRRHHGKNRGVCWFRHSARAHLAQARSLARWLEEQGVAVEELRSTNPGYVLYADAFQVVVDPF